MNGILMLLVSNPPQHSLYTSSYIENEFVSVSMNNIRYSLSILFFYPVGMIGSAMVCFVISVLPIDFSGTITTTVYLLCNNKTVNYFDAKDMQVYLQWHRFPSAHM
jgi:hypothetical protein